MRTFITLLLVATLQIPAAAEQPADPLARLMPPRPVLEDYRDETRFVADVLAWERQRKVLQQRLDAGELKLVDETARRDDLDNWHQVTGPEDLETAINNARGYVQPRYREKYRYNRTTHVSFPLEHLPSDVLAHEVIPSTPHPVALPEMEELPEQVRTQLERLQELTHNMPYPTDVSATP